MNMDLNLLKKQESDITNEHYIYRIGKLIDEGKLPHWKNISDIINNELGIDEENKMNESSFRKPYQYLKRFLNAGVLSDYEDDKYLNELRQTIFELKKEQVKTRDERNEINKLARETAREEKFKHQLLNSIENHVHSPLDYKDKDMSYIDNDGDNDLIISLFDVHNGIEIDNSFNKYNKEVLEYRLGDYLDKIFEIQQRHKSKNAYVILSELLSGNIHPTLRIQNNQDLIEQFLTVIDFMSDFIAELTYRFDKVTIAIAPGNHSRINANKKESLSHENMDHFVIPYLKAKLQNFKNIKYIDNDFEHSIAIFHVRGNLVYASHGDKDNPQNAIQKLTMFTGRKPKLYYCGHRHYNAMSTVYDSKVIQSGALSGTDEYCLDNRLKNRPEQTISVINDNGLECLYDVVF